MTKHILQMSVKPDRTLVKIVKIVSIHPIEGADRIEIAKIKGWQCVVEKNKYHVDELVIYFGIDSILDKTDPNTADFYKNNPTGRIRTIKLRNVLSQGYIVPLTWLSDRGYDISKYDENADITTEMGVTKYVAPEEIDIYLPKGDKHVPYPSFVRKTDEERLQNNLDFLIKLIKRKIVITVKYDGSSFTIIIHNNMIILCSRNYLLTDESQENSHYFVMFRKLGIENELKNLGMNIAIQGELIGPKINGNKIGVSECQYYVFNIWNIDTQTYLLHDDVMRICEILKLNHVPIVFCGESSNIELTLDKLLETANNLKYQNGHLAEGIVIKTIDDENDRVSFKVISNAFLLCENSKQSRKKK